MYERHFGFSDKPFALTPDPRFLYLSEHHREAMAHLLFGMGQGGGFVQLTGEVGTGKTTLCRSVLEHTPEDVDLALILNPALTPLELVGSICDELGIPTPAGTTSMKDRVTRLNHRLLESHAAGRRTVVVIDEAQSLSRPALEQVRLLTNLETPTEKLLQMVLIGQPELQVLMARPDLRQLAQRITARYHLPPLRREESEEYVRHRLRVAGGSPAIFTPSALRCAHRLSGGVPRLLNIICDRALLGAYAEERRTVNGALVRRAWREVSGKASRSVGSRRTAWAAAGLAVLAVATLGLLQTELWSTVGLQSRSSESLPLLESPPKPGAAEEAAPEQGAQSTESDPPPEVTDPAGQLLDRLSRIESSRDKELATLDLLSFWLQEPVSAGAGEVCDAAESRKLRCYDGRGTWTHLAHYNRPAVLELVAPNREKYFALLVAAKENDLFFQTGDTVTTVPRAAIEPFWYGSFTSFWSPPPGGSYVLTEGSQGADVAWLRNRLAAVAGDPGTSTPDSSVATFDELLRQEVLAFQERNGISADGIAGRETLMHLNALIHDIPVPLLHPTEP